MTNLSLPLRWSVAAVAIFALTGCINVTDTGAENGDGDQTRNGSESDEDIGPSEPSDGDTANDDGEAANGGTQDGSFTVTVLGNLPFLSGPPFEDHPITTQGTDINNAGQVIGWSTSGWVYGDQQGILWTDGNVLHIQHSQWTSLHGLNAAGQIVGAAGNDGAGPILAAFLWQDGSIMNIGDIPEFAGPVSSAMDINSESQVVGQKYEPLRAFLWDNGEMVDLGSLPGDEKTTSARAVNDVAQVVGSTSAPVVGLGFVVDGSRSFLWQEGEMVDLGVETSEATDINNHGEIVGTGTINGEQRAFLWEDGEVVNLGTLPGAETSRAAGINELGQVVGAAESDSGSRAFLWEPEVGMRDLNDLIDPSDPHQGAFTLLEAGAINDNGQIVAIGRIEGDEHAILLTPLR